VFIQSGMKDIYTDFSSYIQLWSWPGRLHSGQLHEIFIRSRQKKHRDAKHIKCQASDLLSLMGVLAIFTQQVLLAYGVCNDACHAFLALTDVVDFITSVPRAPLEPSRLDQLVEKFLGSLSGNLVMSG
jgi:hypothetical protein